MNSFKPHPSVRGYFAHAVHSEMKKNKKIWVLAGDLGYGMWDRVREDFPDRFINPGAAEQAMLDIAVGLALDGKIPVVYSITTFLLYRPFETIRNYINYENIPVKLVGSGKGRDYEIDGFSHWAEEDKKVMKLFKNIECRWLKDKEQVQSIVKEMIRSSKPWYLNLHR